MLYPNQIKKCNQCGGEIAFVKSSAGKWYPADVDRSTGKPEVAYQGQGGFVRGKQKSYSFPTLHRCPETRESILATIDRLRDELLEAEAANEQGSWFDATYGIEQAIKAWEGKLAAVGEKG